MAVLHSNCCSPERGNDMKILFFEDREEDIQGIVDYCIERDYDCFHDKFVDGFSKIEEYDPDIVIVDLKNAQDNFEGCDILEKIWEHRFRPTCVFSGQINDSTIEEDRYASPLIEFITKGDEKPVISFIEKVAPYVDCIREVQEETYTAMRRSFDFFDLAMKDGITDSGKIAALCGNRIKAYFDNENSNNDLPTWSQYIYPTINEAFSTADIIQLKTPLSGADYENNFFVILSQSCDIAHSKVNCVLLAKCFPIDRILKVNKGDGTVYERSKEELQTIFNTGFLNQWVPLPGIENVMPDIAVNLKKLSLVKLRELSNDYQKVLSLSSPYKERLVWAYMQTACRPGVPDLDIESWCASLLLEEDGGDVSSEETVEQIQIAENEGKVACTA